MSFNISRRRCVRSFSTQYAPLSDVKQLSVYSQKLPLRVPHHSTDLASVAVRVAKSHGKKDSVSESLRFLSLVAKEMAQSFANSATYS